MALEIDRVREIVDRVAASLNLEVVEVELRGAGKGRMLRVSIDKPGGVTHQDCAGVSREVGTILDVEDVIPGGSYVLEVSSPGLDRKLTNAADFQRFIGSRVRLTTRQPIAGNRFFEGKLEKFEQGHLLLDISPAKPKNRKREAPSEPQHLEIEMDNVEKANLVPEL